MRSQIVGIVLVVMLLALAVLLFARPFGAVRVAAPPEATEQGADARAADGAVAGPDAGAADAARVAAAVQTRVRMVGTGLDLLAPAVLANGGVAARTDGAFGDRRLSLEIRSVDALDALESALAEGGESEGGADIAVLSLPEWVAAYEHLRALSLHVFSIVAWSRGRHALYSQGTPLDALSPRGKLGLAAASGSPEAFLGLFLLDLAGRAPESVTLVTPTDVNATDSGSFVAVDVNASETSRQVAGARLVASTADAAELIPYVMVAPEGFLREHADAVEAFTAAWLDGVETLRRDVPAAARTIARAPNAPETVDLVRRLGRLEFTSLGDAAQFMALSGRDAVTLDASFERTWTLWRAAGVVTTPAPETIPVDTSAIAALARRAPDRARPSGRRRELSFEAPILVAWHAPSSLADEELVPRVGLLAGVFRGSALRIGARSQGATNRLIDAVTERYALPRERFRDGATPRRGRAVVEILAAE